MGESAPLPGTPSWDTLLTQCGLPRLDARALLEHASGKRREWLLAHGDDPAAASVIDAFNALAERRRAGEPLAYLLRFREFHGLRFVVSRDVLVPRPETEGLVDAALEHLADTVRPRLLDLGTGSGAVAITLAVLRPDAQVVATDASSHALTVAQDNARALGATGITWRLGDWFAALAPDEPPFDLVVSNPPYLACDDPHLSDPALRLEPQMALVSGAHGMEAIGAIAAQAPARLRPGGWLMLEHGATQGAAARACLQHAGFVQTETLPDLQGLPRVTLGRWPLLATNPSRRQGAV
jgi:release factor glutamine methyltransferase